MIEGCLAWQQNELNPPTIARDATEAYLGEEDEVLVDPDDKPVAPECAA